MNAHDSAFRYQQSTAFAATAVGQVIALYDAILRDLHRAMEAIAARQIEKSVNVANHSLVVIGELQGVLDFERGGETARHLNSFYNVTRAMISQACVMSSCEQFQELIGMFARVRGAWSHVERTVTPSEPTEKLRISSKQQQILSQDSTVSSEVSEAAGGGGWKA